jgi:hypothetical protein
MECSIARIALQIRRGGISLRNASERDVFRAV